MEVKEIELAIERLRGQCSGLRVFGAVIAAHLSAETAAQALAVVLERSENAVANALASPLSDAAREAMEKELAGLAFVLQARAAQARQSPRPLP